MDSVCAAVVDKWSHLLPSSERAALQNIDLQWLAERSSPVWTAGSFPRSIFFNRMQMNKLIKHKYIETCMKHFTISGGMEENASGKNGFFAANNGSGIGVDVWCSCLCSFLEKDRITSRCLSATANAWIMVYTRLSALYIVVDPTYSVLTCYHRRNLLIIIDFFLQ